MQTQTNPDVVRVPVPRGEAGFIELRHGSITHRISRAECWRTGPGWRDVCDDGERIARIREVQVPTDIPYVALIRSGLRPQVEVWAPDWIVTTIDADGRHTPDARARLAAMSDRLREVSEHARLRLEGGAR